MGERLCLKCIKDGEEFANIYYHWSAYTLSAYTEAKDLLDFILPLSDYATTNELLFAILSYLEKNGGGIDRDDRQAFEKQFPNMVFSDLGNRNNGLLSITARGKYQTSSWANGYLIIDFDKQTVNNHCFSGYDSKETILDDYGDEDGQALIDEIVEITTPIWDLKFDEIDQAIEVLSGIEGIFMVPNDTYIYQVIQ